jgi:hypothetical protein
LQSFNTYCKLYSTKRERKEWVRVMFIILFPSSLTHPVLHLLPDPFKTLPLSHSLSLPLTLPPLLLPPSLSPLSGETLISPEGFFDLDDDEDPPVVKECDPESLNERFPKPAADLKDSDAWKHHVMELNAIGRMLALPEVLDANGDVRTMF